jgi:hypothetical protein
MIDTNNMFPICRQLFGTSRDGERGPEMLILIVLLTTFAPFRVVADRNQTFSNLSFSSANYHTNGIRRKRVRRQYSE